MQPRRGNAYPAEGMDGSPFFLGKPKRKIQRPTEPVAEVWNPALAERMLNVSQDLVVIDDNDSDAELPAKRNPHAISRCKGTMFDFSTDPDVASLNKAVMSVIDPEGKRRTDERLQASVQAAAARKAEILTEKPTKKKNNKGWNHNNFGSMNDFQMASGKGIVKEMKSVVSHGDSESSSQSDGASAPRFFGNKRVAPLNPIVSSGVGKRVAMGMMNDGGGHDEKQGGLRAEPSLKHFDDNIISLIESEIMSVSANTGWSDVAGLEGAKKALREIVVLPFKRPDVFTGIRSPPKGVLLFGPPGTGKTMIGKCVASQCKATFFNISASSLTSKWVGEGEKLVRALFAVARLKLPSVIFIDEIDSLLSARSESEHESSRRIKTEFLVQLDGVATNSDERVLVLGATNRPHELDEAARRRFAKRLYIALPGTEARLSIVRNLLGDLENSVSEEDYENIGRLTAGYSGADMRQLCAEAAMGPIREIDNLPDVDIEYIAAEEIRPVNGEDFVSAVKVVRPTVVAEELDLYQKWDKKFGCLL